MLFAGRREVAGMDQNVSLRYCRRWVAVPLLLAKVVVVRVRDDHKAHVAGRLGAGLDKFGRVQRFTSLFNPQPLPRLCWVVGQGVACSATRGPLGPSGFEAGPAQAVIEGLHRNARTGDHCQLCSCRRGETCTQMRSPTCRSPASTCRRHAHFGRCSSRGITRCHRQACCIHSCTASLRPPAGVACLAQVCADGVPPAGGCNGN